MPRFIPPREPSINVLVDGVLRSVPNVMNGLTRGQAAANRNSRVGITLDTTNMIRPATNFFRTTSMMGEVAIASMELLAWVILQQIIGRTPVQDPPPEVVLAAASWKSTASRRPRSIEIKLENTARDPDTGENYPMMLEFGWSTQAPLGMVRITLEEFRLQLGGLIGGAINLTMRDAWTAQNYIANPLIRAAIADIKAHMRTAVDIASTFAYITDVQNQANRLHGPRRGRRGTP